MNTFDDEDEKDMNTDDKFQKEVDSDQEEDAKSAFRDKTGQSDVSPNSPQSGLDAHNQARASQHVPALVWDDELTAKAQKVAEDCLRAGSLQHSPNRVLYPGKNMNDWNGENLFDCKGLFHRNHDFFRAAVNSWMTEERLYLEDGDKDGAHHYTQVMWKKSKKVGMAMATNGQEYYVVARYWPAGNINSEDPY